MSQSGVKCRGFSMIEMVVVLFIIGILSIAGVTLMNTGQAPAAVRSVLDELEGTLLSAQSLATATGSDVTLASQGDWNATSATPLILARSTVSPPNPPAIVAAGATDPASFKLAVIYNGATPKGIGREHLYAGVVTNAAAAWWTTAMGAYNGRTNDTITSFVPFSTTGSAFNGILATASNNLFQGGAAKTTAVAQPLMISGSNRRFQSTAFIEVVGLRGGYPFPGGPMGLLVVLPNGGSVFKFYNPGVVFGDGKWRRL